MDVITWRVFFFKLNHVSKKDLMAPFTNMV